MQVIQEKGSYSLQINGQVVATTDDPTKINVAVVDRVVDENGKYKRTDILTDMSLKEITEKQDNNQRSILSDKGSDRPSVFDKNSDGEITANELDRNANGTFDKQDLLAKDGTVDERAIEELTRAKLSKGAQDILAAIMNKELKDDPQFAVAMQQLYRVVNDNAGQSVGNVPQVAANQSPDSSIPR